MESQYDIDEIIRIFEGDEKQKGMRDDTFTFMRSYVAPPCPQRPAKNILVATDHANWTSGHYAAVVQMARQLNELGYHAVLSLRYAPPKKRRPQDIDCVFNDSIEKGENGYRGRVERYRDAIEKYDIDTVILNAWLGSMKYWDLAALQHLQSPGSGQRVRVLLHFHSAFTKAHYTLGSNWLRWNVEAIKHFDGLIATSKVDQAFWSAYHPHAYYRPLPVKECSSFDLANEPAGPRAICISRFSDVKNQKAAIRAFAQVVKRVPDAQLVLAGDDLKGYRQQCSDLAAKLGLQDNVQVVGYVAGKEKDELLRTALFAVNTSVYEGFSLYMFEAKAAGLPVVVADLPNLTLLEGGEENGAVVVPQDNADLLADAMVRLFGDADECARLGAAARRHAQEIASFDYRQFWEDAFESMGTESSLSDEALMQQRVYASMLQARASNSRELARLKRDSRKLGRIEKMRSYQFAVKMRDLMKKLHLHS